MLTIDKFKKLETVKHDTEQFNKVFGEMFIEAAKRNLTVLELDTVIEMIVSSEHNNLRIYLEELTDKARIKVLNAVDEGNPDEVYQNRYQRLKELDDLYSYFMDNF